MKDLNFQVENSLTMKEQTYQKAHYCEISQYHEYFSKPI